MVARWQVTSLDLRDNPLTPASARRMLDQLRAGSALQRLSGLDVGSLVLDELTELDVSNQKLGDFELFLLASFVQSSVRRTRFTSSRGGP